MPFEPAVLLVDDSADTLEMYALGLAFAGFRPLTASDPQSALGQIRKERPAAVVTDLQLVGNRGGGNSSTQSRGTRPLGRSLS